MTYKQIQECYKQKFKKSIKTCWIADTKRQLGIKVRKAYNRKNEKIHNKCPKDVLAQIAQILKERINCF